MPKTRVEWLWAMSNVAYYKDKMSQMQNAQKLKCPWCAKQIILKAFEETKDIKTIQRTGRKKSLSRDDRPIIRQSMNKKQGEKHCFGCVQTLTR